MQTQEINMENQIILTPNINETQITIEQSSIEVRNALVERARSVSKISDSREADNAAGILKEINNMLKITEQTRKAVKEPVLSLGKRIDATAKEFVADLERAKAQLSTLIVNYNLEIERKRKEEEERIRREQEEAQRKLEEAQAAKSDSSFEDFIESGNKIDEAKAEVERTSALEPHFSGAKASGTTTYKVKSFEIEDELALQKSHPELFSPDPVKIRAYIKLLPDNAKVEGLKIIIETKVKTC